MDSESALGPAPTINWEKRPAPYKVVPALEPLRRILSTLWLDPSIVLGDWNDLIDGVIECLRSISLTFPCNLADDRPLAPFSVLRDVEAIICTLPWHELSFIDKLGDTVIELMQGLLHTPHAIATADWTSFVDAWVFRLLPLRLGSVTACTQGAAVPVTVNLHDVCPQALVESELDYESDSDSEYTFTPTALALRSVSPTDYMGGGSHSDSESVTDSEDDASDSGSPDQDKQPTVHAGIWTKSGSKTRPTSHDVEQSSEREEGSALDTSENSGGADDESGDSETDITPMANTLLSSTDENSPFSSPLSSPPSSPPSPPAILHSDSAAPLSSLAIDDDDGRLDYPLPSPSPSRYPSPGPGSFSVASGSGRTSKKRNRRDLDDDADYQAGDDDDLKPHPKKKQAIKAPSKPVPRKVLSRWWAKYLGPDSPQLYRCQYPTLGPSKFCHSNLRTAYELRRHFGECHARGEAKLVSMEDLDLSEALAYIEDIARSKDLPVDGRVREEAAIVLDRVAAFPGDSTTPDSFDISDLTAFSAYALGEAAMWGEFLCPRAHCPEQYGSQRRLDSHRKKTGH